MSHRNMTAHMLTPLRAYAESGHLVTNIKTDPVQAAASEFYRIPAGRCLHTTNATGPNEVPICKLGCEGNGKIPVFLFRDSDSYSAGYEGPNPATALVPAWSTGQDSRLLAFVGLEGYELATTEFDTTRTYLVGQALRSPEVGSTAGVTDVQVDVQNHAGMLTNASVVHGADTIVGIVSPGFASPQAEDPGIDEHLNKVLTFYTRYTPPIQGLLNGTPTNLT
jgi:hypothetical protein